MQRMRAWSATSIGVALALAAAIPAQADHPQPAPDISKVDYAPIGVFAPGERQPGPADFETQIRPLMEDRRFNPSGKYNAFDTNVFETLGLPYRAAGDTNADDPYGNGGDPRHGYCDSDPDPDLDTERPGRLAPVAGECPNHQIEYSRYFADTMRDILGDFGVSIRRYRFHNPGGDNTQSGTAINTAAVVAGADHPDQTVIVSGHFDQTNDGPASAWDSAEGHAQVIRIAKILADYWRATGTRPSATVKFVPWDAEESGTLGSKDYVENNVVPGEEHEVRGYWNTDPCAGGYPAYRFGNPADRVDLGIQLANPDRVDDPITFESENPPESARARIEAFNARAPQVVEQVFDHLDDTVTVRGEQRPIFVSTAEAEALGVEPDIGTDVIIGDSRPILFGSDWINFENVGIPFFNPGPEVTGPSTQLEPGNPDGLAILHTPNDNHRTLNAYSSDDQSGETISEGWVKGMEMCAQLLAWGMAQPEQGGAQTTDGDVVAYYEALPNEATARKPVRFDAGGSYQYADAGQRSFVDESLLEYSWDFGDGTTGSGKRAEHVYATPGVYESRLTVRNAETGGSATMSVPITVVPSQNPALAGPVLEAPESDDDGTFTLEWSRVAGDVERYVVEETRGSATALFDDAEGNLEDRWTVETTVRDTGALSAPRARGWRKSSNSDLTLSGNKRSSGASSYWTGVALNETGVDFESSLIAKQPIAIPEGGDAALTYSTWYENTFADRAYVEAAVDDGDPATPLDWATVDAISGEEHVGYLPGVDVLLDEQPQALDGMEVRRVDLSQFAGQRVLLRFRAVWTGSDYVFTSQYGWYVDDIQVDAGRFERVGESTTESFEVTGREPGTYGYRVRGVYEDGLLTGPSNTEDVVVEAAQEEPEPTPPAGGGEPSPGGDGPCTEQSRAATPEGEGHDHQDIAQHRFACRVRQVAFDSLRDELGNRPDVLLGEMDVKADKAVIAVTYPESGFLLFDVADPAQPRFLSWYRSSECEGLVIDVDCGAYVDLSNDASTVFMSVQNISAIPGGRPWPGSSGVAKPTAIPGVEVVDVSNPDQPLLSQEYVVASGLGGTHT
jgi:PKD repeat protein